jgi:ornithine carbamoyltransferase
MKSLQGRDLLSVADLTSDEILFLLDLAKQMKTGVVKPHCPRVLGLLFSKASTRTRVSFSVAIYQLGGQVLDLQPNLTQVGRGEPIADTARVLSRYLDALAIRTFDQHELEQFAHHADIPVINALTDAEHPCQLLADLLTIQDCFGSLAGHTLTYLGDGNNVAHSLLLGCALVGMHVRVATPSTHPPDAQILAKANMLANGQTDVVLTDDPTIAIRGADVVYTDVWASMGQEASGQDRIPIFQSYQVNSELLALAEPHAIVLHCLPAHRGEEITEDVLEGSQSRVWDQAENRLHAQKALLACVLGADLS